MTHYAIASLMEFLLPHRFQVWLMLPDDDSIEEGYPVSSYRTKFYATKDRNYRTSTAADLYVYRIWDCTREGFLL